MRSMLVFVAALALAAPAAAQPAKSRAAVVTQRPAGQIILAELKPGLTVKDKNGVLVGQVVEVTKDASGRETVVIRMGENTLAVDQTSLTYDDAAAYLNATLFQLRTVLQR